MKRKPRSFRLNINTFFINLFKLYLAMFTVADTHLGRGSVCVYAAVLVWGFMLQLVSMTLSFKDLQKPEFSDIRRVN